MPRILIVDDDPGQRSLLDSFLRSQGFETLPVSSGERALEVLRDEQVSMMISDVRMPGLSGLETLRRARQENAVLPVLMVTAYTDVRAMARSITWPSLSTSTSCCSMSNRRQVSAGKRQSSSARTANCRRH